MSEKTGAFDRGWNGAGRGKVLPCHNGCRRKHPYQDDKFGAGKRHHTEGKNHYTCTVCGATTPKGR